MLKEKKNMQNVGRGVLDTPLGQTKTNGASGVSLRLGEGRTAHRGSRCGSVKEERRIGDAAPYARTVVIHYRLARFNTINLTVILPANL